MLIKCYGEFSFLPNSALSGLDVPQIKFIRSSETELVCAGYYDPNDALVVACVDDHLQDHVPATIAHEFMHYTQHMNGRLDLSPPRFNCDKPYEDAIRDFYKSSKQEYEALLFEFSVAKNWCNEWQFRKLVNELN